MSVADSTEAAASACITIARRADVACARVVGGQLADSSSFGTTQRYCLTTSISELASNILDHATSGTITLAIVGRPDGAKGVQIVATDSGRGIEDLGLAMQDGYSTRGGIGGGLPGVRRLMSEMEVSSTPGSGTTVRAVKWADDASTNSGG